MMIICLLWVAHLEGAHDPLADEDVHGGLDAAQGEGAALGVPGIHGGKEELEQFLRHTGVLRDAVRHQQQRRLHVHQTVRPAGICHQQRHGFHAHQSVRPADRNGEGWAVRKAPCSSNCPSCGECKLREGVVRLGKDAEGVLRLGKDAEGLLRLGKDAEGVVCLGKDAEGGSMVR
eukprot:6003650-Pyramimonas_sp.AAC.1